MYKYVCYAYRILEPPLPGIPTYIGIPGTKCITFCLEVCPEPKAQKQNNPPPLVSRIRHKVPAQFMYWTISAGWKWSNATTSSYKATSSLARLKKRIFSSTLKSALAYRSAGVVGSDPSKMKPISRCLSSECLSLIYVESWTFQVREIVPPFPHTWTLRKS
jgi:hypothetical protein